MQYFGNESTERKTQLLFYLVTRVFAQSYSSLTGAEFKVKSRKAGGYAVEHVLAYPGAVPQVPYNQHLGLACASSIRGIRFSDMAERNEKHGESRRTEIQQTVEQAVAQAIATQMPKLQSQIVQQVLEVLPAQVGEAPLPAREEAGLLVRAVSNIHAGSTQKEILRALLDNGSAYCSRIALFVVKAGSAAGWQARGLADDAGVKDFPLDLSVGPVAHTYQNRVATPGNIAEMGGQFGNHFGRPANEQVLVLPLTLKDKVAALVYADGGESGKLDADALELLVIATSAWLEVTSLRKHAPTKEDGDSAARAEIPAALHTVSSFSDPFAAHSPKHVPASIPVEAEPAAEVVEVASAHVGSAAAAPAAATDPLAGLSPEDADTHRKAQRFARLLVDEIKLYNQAKVAEGRRNKDLYDRLKEDIDKSRGTFQKRYGSTAAASGDYFQAELLRSLAEDDISIMGANFRR